MFHQEKVPSFNMHVTDANMHVTVPTCDFAKITCQHVWQSFTHMLQNSNMHVAKFQHGVSNIRTWRYRYEHACYRYEHACYRCEHGKISVYLSPQKREHHRHPTVPTHETRQIPTHNTLVCASRTNNTYTFHALPRKILCTRLVHHQTLTVHPHLPGSAHVHAPPCAVRHQFRILMNAAASTVDLSPCRHPTAPTTSEATLCVLHHKRLGHGRQLTLNVESQPPPTPLTTTLFSSEYPVSQALRQRPKEQMPCSP